MNFAREGLAFVVVAALLAAGMFAVALNRRSWPLWLVALALVVVALSVAYFFRTSVAGPAAIGELPPR